MKDSVSDTPGHRSQTLSELPESFPSVSSMLDSVTDGILMMDQACRVVYMNHAAECHFSSVRISSTAMTFWEQCPSLSNSKLAEAFHRGMTEQTVVELEDFNEQRGLWSAIKCHPAPCGGLTVHIRDITALKTQREEVATRATRFRQLADAMPQIVYENDADGRVVFINRQWFEYTGQNEAQTADLSSVVHPEDLAPMVERWKEAMATGTVLQAEFRLRRGADGEYRWFLTRAVPVLDEAGCVLKWYGTSTDIHDQKLAEEEVVRLAATSERQKRLYETVLNNTPDFIYVFSLDHKVLYANDALITMWGRGHEGAIGKTFLEIGYEPWHAELHDREIDRVRATRQPIRGEVPFHGAHGWRQYDYIFVPVIGADGEVEAVAGTTRDVTERMEAERAIHAGEERLRTALTAARMVAWEWTPADGRLRVSDNAVEVFGLLESSRLTSIEHGLSLVHPDDVPGYQATFQRVMEDQSSYLTRYRLIRPRDGQTIWIEERGHAVVDEPGGAVRLFGVAADVTDRHNTEVDRERLLLQVQGERGRLAAVFRQSPAFMCVLQGANHVFEMANDRYFDLVGHRDILGKTVREALPEVEEQGFIGMLDTVYRTGEPFIGTSMRVLLEQSTERYLDFVYQPFRDLNGIVTGVVVVGVDMTAHHKAESALRLSEERFRTLFSTMDEGFCVVDVQFDPPGHPVDYRIEMMNAAFETHTGMIGLTGKSMRQEFPDLEEFWFETYGRVALTGEAARFVHKAAPMQGRWFEVVAFRLGGEGSSKVAILFKDISARKHAEAEREQLVQQLREQDRRKDEFLATLAHELRNPLAPIRNGLQIIRMTETDDTIETVRSMMDRQLTQLIRLVDDLLDISRVTSGKLELRLAELEMQTIIHAATETTRPAMEQGRHELTIVMPEGGVFVVGDEARLTQVISNLLNNAAKYTHSGGRIELRVECDARSAIVSVKDNGIGLPPAMLSSVFNMFVQVDRTLEKTTGGLGIGLSLVKGIIEMHGGTVTAFSHGEGRGSEFVVRLPMLPDRTRIASGSSDPESTLLGDGARRILIVDDNADATNSLARVLELLGNVVCTAYDGEAGIKAAQAFRPDVVLMDIGMPKLNGHEACRYIRDQPWGRNILMVAVTGWGLDNDRQQSAAAGFEHHLVKPVDPVAVMTLIATVSNSLSGVHTSARYPSGDCR